jgi:hypothetical protein
MEYNMIRRNRKLSFLNLLNVEMNNCGFSRTKRIKTKNSKRKYEVLLINGG